MMRPSQQCRPCHTNKSSPSHPTPPAGDHLFMCPTEILLGGYHRAFTIIRTVGRNWLTTALFIPAHPALTSGSRQTLFYWNIQSSWPAKAREPNFFFSPPCSSEMHKDFLRADFILPSSFQMLSRLDPLHITALLWILTWASCCQCRPVPGCQPHLWMRKLLPTGTSPSPQDC